MPTSDKSHIGQISEAQMDSHHSFCPNNAAWSMCGILPDHPGFNMTLGAQRPAPADTSAEHCTGRLQRNNRTQQRHSPNKHSWAESLNAIGHAHSSRLSTTAITQHANLCEAHAKAQSLNKLKHLNNSMSSRDFGSNNILNICIYIYLCIIIIYIHT